MTSGTSQLSWVSTSIGDKHGELVRQHQRHRCADGGLWNRRQWHDAIVFVDGVHDDESTLDRVARRHALTRLFPAPYDAAMFSPVLTLCLALLSPAAPAAAPAPARPELLVFAAASLSDALTEVGRAYSAAGGGRRVEFSFGASNDLARQIEAGAPAQVFVSANEAQVTRLERSGFVQRGVAFPVLGNRLVVVVPRESKVQALASPKDLLAFERLSLADPAAVPAGIYARGWLQREGLWEQLAARVVPALDVRAALAAVAAGNLPAGIVYATDAASSDRVRVVLRVAPEATPDLRYFAAPLTSSGAPAAEFLAFLRGPAARQIFARYGFLPLAAAPPVPAPVPPPHRPPSAPRSSHAGSEGSAG